MIFHMKKGLTGQEGSKEPTEKEAKKEQDFKKKSIVNRTRDSWMDNKEGNVLSMRGQDKCGKDLGWTWRRCSSDSDCKQLIQWLPKWKGDGAAVQQATVAKDDVKRNRQKHACLGRKGSEQKIAVDKMEL